MKENLYRPFSSLNVILLGPPGAGKTTFVENIRAVEPSISYISLGKITRAVPSESDLGKRFAALHATTPPCPWPADLVVDLVKSEVLKFKDSGFILDGVPKKEEEARLLLEFLNSQGIPIDMVIELTVDQATATKRLMDRNDSQVRPEQLDHYSRRHQLHLNNIAGINKILSKVSPCFYVIDTSNLLPSGVLQEFEQILTGQSLQKLNHE